MSCKTCTHWTPTKESEHYMPEDKDGVCVGIQGDSCVNDVKAGWDGGYVGEILTTHDFCCANFKLKASCEG